ncbi:NmrA family NAD(P)-binding protein [Mycobacterium sp. ITM-2016-00316]|uniref:SDR family oxidoreductase n=1 Tax=Mycobacterium sp. ITM-2016-00316 TaxID=2099695 RepID=UPI000CFA67E9|nr:NmrA family NAD(P)-binding protein [Mycobacterium sp. ITM-2016-00316]WNG83454.1 NmrA family NAD(P)-binding protein [Mycobacterium sp. ITM-2016-00316]
MILVTSAAGGVGRPLVRQLVANGQVVRAFVKNEDQARRSRGDGAAEIVIGDLRRPGDLERALRGARRIYHAAPTQLVDELPVAERLIEAAQDEQLDQVVFHSVIHPDIAELPHHRQKLRVEGILRDSGLPVTVLRPSHYMQNVLDFWDFFGAGLLPYPTSPESRMGVVDVEDIAAAAANVLITPGGHIGKTYDLSTVELTRHDMAQIWSRVLGHPMDAVRIPPQALTNPLVAIGPFGSAIGKSLLATRLGSLPDVVRGLRAAPNARGFRSWSSDAQDTYVQMMKYYDVHGLPAGNLDDLSKVLPRKAIDYEQFARRTATARGVAAP